jgi:hypothetical protein
VGPTAGPLFFWFVFFGGSKKMNSPEKGEKSPDQLNWCIRQTGKHEYMIRDPVTHKKAGAPARVHPLARNRPAMQAGLLCQDISPG